jgi:DNA-binding CsgD family transcriptional regulator
VGTGGAGVALLTLEQKARGTFSHRRHDPGDPRSLSHNFVRVITGDSRGMIWVGTDSGGLNRYDPESDRFFRYAYHPDDETSISSNSILSILETADGILWVGTADAGLNKFNRESETFTSYSREEGLPDNTVYAMLEDNDHNLWISTKKGLARFTPRTGEFVCFNEKDGLQGNEFNTLACYRNPENGQMYFGGLQGITTFFPENIRKNLHQPPVLITTIEVLNRKSGLTRVPGQSELKLSYRDFMFSFEFVALDFTDPRRNRYAYRLEGFHDHWIRAHWTNRRATFTNIPAGRYTLKVRGSNHHGVWNDQGASVQIIIKPPFWQTWWFRITLMVFFALAIMALHKRRLRHLRLRLKTEEEINKIYGKVKITDREAEIIELLKKRKSYKQIEDELFISYHTVKNHIQNIYKKLDVNDRTELFYYLKSIEDEVKKRDDPSPSPSEKRS